LASKLSFEGSCKLKKKDSSYIALAPPILDGDNYPIWAARAYNRDTYLEANDLSGKL